MADNKKDINSEKIDFYSGASEASETDTFTPEQENFINQQIELENKYGDKEVEAAALGAARGLTFGLSDQLLTKLGRVTGYTREDLKNIKDLNELSSAAGEIGGVVLPTLLSGGAGALGATARAASTGIRGVEALGAGAAKLAEKGFASALASEGKKSIAKDIIRRNVPKTLGSAVEGSAYGLGQLVSEDALGNAEITAENALASIGTGALLGGAAYGIFQAPKLLAPIAGKVTGTVSNKLSKLIDPGEAVLGLMGTTAKQAEKIKKFRPDFMKESPAWLVEKAKLSAFKGSKSLKDDITLIRTTAADQISKVGNEIDDILIKNADNGLTNSATKDFGEIAHHIQNIEANKLIDGIGLSKLQTIKKSAISLAKNAKKSGEISSATKLRKFKQELDDIIPYGSETTKSEIAEIKTLRTMVNDKIHSLAKTAEELGGEGLVDRLVSSNKDYSYASIILPNIESKITKEEVKKGMFGLSDMVLGGLSVDAFGGIYGTAAVGLKKLADSDFRRRLTILKSYEKANKSIDDTINTGIKGFFKDKKFNAIPAMKKAIMSSSYSLGEQDQKPKDKKEAFKNVQTRITELIANPEKLQETITRRTIHLSNNSPNTTAQLTMTAVKGLEFLNSKLPKQASNNLNNFTKREFVPSELQLSKFERYLEAVENPMSTIEDLKSGTLTREASEAIQVVYPNIFMKMQENVISEIENSKEPVSYSKRLQLGILLNISTDPSMSGQNIAALQANLMVPTEQGPTPARADSINMAERADTKQNRIAQR